MAQASFDSAHFSCSICLGVLQEPVTIPCGHSYCMKCLSDYWDRHSSSSCPQCRTSFTPRPTLGRNVVLDDMIRKLSGARVNDGPSAPPMYEVLSSEERQGFQHDTFHISTGRRDRNEGQRLVQESRRRIAVEIKAKEEEVHQLTTNLQSFSRAAKAAVKDCSRIFSELMEFLERRRVELKTLIRAQEKAEVTRAENHRQHLERRLLELRRNDAELEKLSLVQDRGDDIIAQMCQSLCRPQFPWDDANALTVCSSFSFSPVRKVVSELKDELQNVYQSSFTNVTSAVKTANLVRMEKTKAEMCDFDSVPVSDDRNDRMRYFCQQSLDPFTAHRDIFLSEGNRSARRTGQIQSYPDHPDRFDTWCQVLCREGLQGRNYWEAQWDGQVVLGLSYEDIGRKGSSDSCRLGHNSSSWTLRCTSSSLWFCHAKQDQQLQIPAGADCSRIGVFLDYDGGAVCFYAVGASQSLLLHRANAKFVRPLHAAVWLGNKSAVTFCAADSLGAAI